MMLLFWLIIGFGIYYLYTNRNQTTQGSNKHTAEDTLKERFVNGEIDTETYQKMLRTLQK